MTAKELIQFLSTVDPSTEIVIMESDRDGAYSLTPSRLEHTDGFEATTVTESWTRYDYTGKGESALVVLYAL